MPRFTQHCRQRWRGPATKIQARCTGGQLPYQRFSQTRQKTAVTRVVDAILVQIVLCFFSDSIEVIAKRYENQLATLALQVLAALIAVVVH